MQKNDFKDTPVVNRRKAGLFSAAKHSSFVNNDSNEIPTVIDQLLDYNRKLVAMEKGSQSPGQSSPKDLPRLRGRRKIGLKDDKLFKNSGTKNDTSGTKIDITSKQKTGKRSLRSNATPEVGNVKVRPSVKVSQDAAGKKLSPGKKIFKKSQDSVLTKIEKCNASEESILRNGKKKRKAQSPVFPEKDTIKKKVKKLIGDSNSLASSTPFLDISKNEEVQNELSIGDKVKAKRLSIDDVASTHSKSDLEDKDTDTMKGESELVSKVTNSQMKIKNRKKKSRSIEKTGGNIWAVDSNGSELAISDTASNTSRRSSFNSITSDNNSNSQDVKLDQSLNPMVIEKTTLTLNLNSNQVQDEKLKNEQTSDFPPLVKTQLVVPFSINNKPVSKAGNKIKRLNILAEDTIDNTVSDALDIDSDSCVTDDDPALSHLKVLNKKIVIHNSNEIKGNEQISTVDTSTLSDVKVTQINTTSVEDHINNSETILLNHNTVLESELLEVNESQLKNEPKRIVEEESCDSKDNDMSEEFNQENCENTNIKDLSDPSPTKENVSYTKGIEKSISNSQCRELPEENVISNNVLVNNDSSEIGSMNVLDQKYDKIVLNEKSNEDSFLHEGFSVVSENETSTNTEQSNSSNVTELTSVFQEVLSGANIKRKDIDITNASQNDENTRNKWPTIKETEETIKETEETLEKTVKDHEETIKVENTMKETEDTIKIENTIKDTIDVENTTRETNDTIKEIKDTIIEAVQNPEETIKIDKTIKETIENSEKTIKIETMDVEKTMKETKENPTIKETEENVMLLLCERNKTSTTKNDTSSIVEVMPDINKEMFLNPKTGLLENVCQSSIKKAENPRETHVSKEAILNISIDSDIEKLKENFISPDHLSTKVDDNDSLYEDTDMVKNDLKKQEGRSEELKIVFNETITAEISASLIEESSLPDEEMKEIIQTCPGEIPSKLNELVITSPVENKTDVCSEIHLDPKVEDQVDVKCNFKSIMLEESSELKELEECSSSLVECKMKMNFLKNLKLQSKAQLLSNGEDVQSNKKTKVCFGIKESCLVKDESYTGTLKVTLTRKRDGEKNMCHDDHIETEALEYKICPKRVHKHNYRNLPLTPMTLLHSECSQSPPISLYKESNLKPDYSYRVLMYVGPIGKDEPSTVLCQESSALGNASVVEVKTDDDSNVKPTRKRIVIPEKSSSFSIHPQRLCEDVCKYCYTKFGSLDTPCHIAQLKSSQLQNHVLKTIIALGTNLSSDSCLCDACYRRVIRVSQEKTTPYPVKKKKKRSKENVPCQVPECRSNGIHTVTKKVFHKIRRALRNKFSIEMERLTSAIPLNLCTDHYHWVLVALRCFVCEKRQVKQMSEPRTERVLLKAQLESEGISVQMVDQSSYICKMCKYFCSLLSKKNHMTPSAKDFFDSYKITLLNKNNSGEQNNVEKKLALSEDSNTELDVRKASVSLDVSQNSSPSSNCKKEDSVISEPESLSQHPVKLPGEDDIVLHTDLDINNPAKSSSSNLERFNTTIQFDTETKKLYQKLLRPYGNQSSFLRHLVILEKYFREGSLVLKEGASSKAQKYINTVNNRIQACHGVVQTPVKNINLVSNESTHQRSSVSDVPIASVTSTATSNVSNANTTATTATVNQPRVTSGNWLSTLKFNSLMQRGFPVLKPAPPIKLVKNKNSSHTTKPPIPDLNPIERPVEIISSPEISLYNIPAESNGANSKRLKSSPALEITPDVSISKTCIPKMKSISSSVPISQSNLPSANMPQSNVVLFFPPSTSGNAPIVSFSQSNTIQAPFDVRRQSFTDTKMSHLNPRVSKVGTPSRFVISQVRSLAPKPMHNTNNNIRPRQNSNELRFPVGTTPTSGELLLAAFPTLVNNNITVRGSNQNNANMSTGQIPAPNYMVYPRGPRPTSPNMPPVPYSSGQGRSLSGSQVANRNDKNLIRTLLNARPDLQTTFQGN